MKKLIAIAIFSSGILMTSCKNEEKQEPETASNEVVVNNGGQENVQDDVSQKDVVKIAMGSKDHTTLVAAVKQADLVTSLSNAGPFTVFAPTNAAFDLLPAGTVEALMKDDKKNRPAGYFTIPCNHILPENRIPDRWYEYRYGEWR